MEEGREVASPPARETGPAAFKECENCGRTLRHPPLTRKYVLVERCFCSGKCAAEFDARCEDPFSWVTLENLDIFATKPERHPRARAGKEEVEAVAPA